MKKKKLGCMVGLIIVLTTGIMGCSSKKQTTMDAAATEQVAEQGTEQVASTTELTANMTALEMNNRMDDQAAVEEQLLEMAKTTAIADASVVVNPYGTAELSGVICFHTEEAAGGTVTAKGKATEDDITVTFEAATDHVVPVYGLYSADTTQIEVALDNGETYSFEASTEACAIDMTGVESEVTNSEVYNYEALTFVCSNASKAVYALDSKGAIRFVLSSEVGSAMGLKQLQNGHLIVTSGYVTEPRYYCEGIVEFDLLGKIYHQYDLPGGSHHDIEQLPNGNLLVASSKSDYSVVENEIRELDYETGEVVWELNLSDLIPYDAAMCGGTNVNPETDPFHNNGLFYDETTDSLLVSCRQKDAILSIDMNSSSLKWILGDPTTWPEEYLKYFFTPEGDDFEWQYVQHMVSVTSEGNIMCFDNGGTRKKGADDSKEDVTGTDVYSRYVIYDIDTDNMTIREVDEWGRQFGDNHFSGYISGVLELAPQDYFSCFGCIVGVGGDYSKGLTAMYGEDADKATSETYIYEVYQGEEAYSLHLNSLIYRAMRYDPSTITYNIGTAGTYLGTMGETAAVEDATYDITHAQPLAELDGTLNVSLDPMKLTFAGNYTIEVKAEEEVVNSYMMLVGEDGTQHVYKANETAVVSEDGASQTQLVSASWVSCAGQQGVFDVYYIADDVVYNTGYYIEL